MDVDSFTSFFSRRRRRSRCRRQKRTATARNSSSRRESFGGGRDVSRLVGATEELLHRARFRCGFYPNCFVTVFRDTKISRYILIYISQNGRKRRRLERLSCVCALRCRVFFFVERARGIEATLLQWSAKARASFCVKKQSLLFRIERAFFLDIFFPALFFRSINLSFFLSNFLGEDDDDDDARRRRKRQSPLDPHP